MDAQIWPQVYDPFGSMLLSTIIAAVPVIVLLGAIGIFEMKAHLAALLGLVCALLVAIIGFGMPSGMALMSAVYGGAFGLFPIGWIILNVIFLYQLTNEKGEFDVLQRSIRGISDDRRLQLLFIAFCFGAFFEGAAGFGTPVAVTAAMLIQYRSGAFFIIRLSARDGGGGGLLKGQ
jgi:lactate permease